MPVCPFAIQKSISGTVGRYNGGPYKIVHHTTEGSTAQSAFDAYKANMSDPHFTLDHVTIYQHIDTGTAARSLENLDGGVDTNRDSAIQIEVVGYAGRPKDKWTLLNLARLCRWLEKEHAIPKEWPNGFPKPPKNGKDPGGHNRNSKNWDTKGGHFGHCHVPENTHWDPAYTQAEVDLLMAAEFDNKGTLLNPDQPAIAGFDPESAEGEAVFTVIEDHHSVGADDAPGEGAVDPLLAAITDEMVAEALAAAAEDVDGQDDWRDLISQRGYEFIVRWETGGRAYYEKHIKGQPIWPGYSSGVTIGCGYDLGYHSLAEFRADWSGRIPVSQIDRLAAAIGLRSVEPDRAGRIRKINTLLASLADIVVPWQVAIDQFDAVKMPKLVTQLYAHLDQVRALHPHCRGALLSLVFNRGPAFAKAGDRFLEMRATGAAMNAGPSRFAEIPGQLRSMKRIWGADSSLANRREGEAVLFERGLAGTP